MTQQGMRQPVYGISIDKNITHNDNLNGSVQWLTRKIDSQSWIPPQTWSDAEVLNVEKSRTKFDIIDKKTK